MPFNQAILLAGRPIYNLVDAGGTGVYNVENKVVSTFGVNTIAYALVVLTITGDRKAADSDSLAIDATGMHDGAELVIILSNADVEAVGGDGGDGGGVTGSWEGEVGTYVVVTVPEPEDGTDGGSAISLGCDTKIQGTGNVRGGHGGGGGGGAYGLTSGPPFDGGSGGGGGTPYGLAGTAGSGTTNNGNVGTAATETAKGSGGAAVGSGGAGGDGGEHDTVPQAGENKTTNGGAAGSDGYTVIKNGFTLTTTGVTMVGDEAA